MTVEKPKPTQLLRPITTGADSAMNQSQLLAITCNSFKAQEKSHVHGAIGFGFASHWMKNWCESFKPITKRSDGNHVITFDSHLKTALGIAVKNNNSLLNFLFFILELIWRSLASQHQTHGDYYCLCSSWGMVWLRFHVSHGTVLGWSIRWHMHILRFQS